MTRTPLRLSAFLAITALVGAAVAQADDFPSRPLIMVVPFAAGSGADITARTVGNGLSQVLKQPVVVEDHDGASGQIGLSYTARTKADGYTIVMGGIGGVVLHPAVEGAKMSFSPQKELAPVALIAKASPVLVVNASLGVKTLPELIELAKKQPLTYGSPGVGSAMHLTGELMKQVTGAPMTHVPYRGQGLVIADVVAGNINLSFNDVSVALPFAKDNRVRIIAVAGKERAPQMPDIPTTAELGFPKLVMENWYALYAPRDTPAPIIARLADAAKDALNLPDVRTAISKTTGLIPLGTGPDSLRQQMAEDTEKWTPIASRLGE
ncbi:MAG TPA: tripartite tricarboxylate transporter substrate binding protein [Xanthobacteraceae bacterium]|jgi:tripartite-type tricarboxylate transporter receptor subunit TctC|nr:tripartite tricarboxylate transporter substrate binding protein [Xanthobacteraceae bacterium]